MKLIKVDGTEEEIPGKEVEFKEIIKLITSGKEDVGFVHFLFDGDMRKQQSIILNKTINSKKDLSSNIINLNLNLKAMEIFKIYNYPFNGDIFGNVILFDGDTKII
jgi:hypothetical protein